MLWKPQAIEVNPDQPFANDRLDREKHVNNLRRLLRTSPDSIVVAVDGRWGSGKTTFLRFLEASLQSEHHPVVSFNAWNADFVEEPLLPILSEVVNLGRQYGMTGESEDDPLHQVKEYGGVLLRRGLPVLIRAGTHGIVDVGDLGGLADEIATELGEQAAKATESYLEEYEDSKDSVELFQESLSALVEYVETEDEATLPIVLIIDELDRCRPDFAISVLERIKHVFSVPGVSFVLGLHHAELAHSVRGVYGSSFGGERYLDRLIDLRYELPDPDAKDFVDHLFDASGANDLIASYATDIRGATDFMKATIIGLASTGRLTARLQQRVVAMIALILRITPRQTELDLLLLTLLVAVRRIDADLYREYTEGRIGAEEIWNRIAMWGDFEEHVDVRVAASIRGALYARSGIDGETSERVKLLASKLNDFGGDHSEEKVKTLQEKRSLQQRQGGFDQLRLLCDRIELARRFR